LPSSWRSTTKFLTGGLFVAAVFALTLVGLNAVADQSESQASESDPEYTQAGADTCLTCHGGDHHLLQIFEGPHAVKGDTRSPFGQTQCEACHGPGADHAGPLRIGQERPPMPGFGDNALWSSEQENQACLTCHQGSDHRFWKGSAHHQYEVGCVDCHSMHERRDPMSIATIQNQVCSDCHTQVRSETHRAYAHPVRHGEMACTDCHQPHGSGSEAMLTSMTVNQNCYECHAETRGPFLWEHAPVAEDCTLCHQPHGSNNPAMLTRRAPMLCQQCHTRLGHAGVGRTPDDLPGGASPSNFTLGQSCMNCHSQVHGSNHPSGAGFLR